MPHASENPRSRQAGAAATGFYATRCGQERSSGLQAVAVAVAVAVALTLAVAASAQDRSEDVDHFFAMPSYPGK